MTNEPLVDPSDVTDALLDDLMELHEKIGALIAEYQSNSQAEALRRIRCIVKDNELTFDEVMRAIRVTARRGKAPAIYRNPANPRQTWSGNGEAPDWFQAAEDKDSLRIDPS